MASRDEIREQTRQTRQTLIDAALDLSATQGFASLSLRSVARSAGIAPTSFYRHFRDMDELGVELVDEVEAVLREFGAEVQRRLDAIDSSTYASIVARCEETVRRFIDTFLDYVTNHLNLFHFFFQLRSGSSSRLRGISAGVLDKLIHECSLNLHRFAENNVFGNRIGLIAETVVELMFNGGLEMLDEKDNKDEVIERILLKVRMMIAGAIP
jgi:TetR/AcrR family transcriptional regulator, fatty acid biosynthesis regulator